MQSLFRSKIQHQLLIIVSLLVILLVAAIAVVNYQSSSQLVMEDTKKRMESELRNSANLLSPSYHLNLRLTQGVADNLVNKLKPLLTLNPNETNNILNQPLQNLMLNNDLLVDNFTVVDQLTAEYKMPITVFQRTQNDDFIRVSTSLKKENGKRAYGTLLGKEKHPGYQTLTSGNSYYGMASLFGKNYVTAYIPLKINSDEYNVIVFSGLEVIDTLAAIKKATNTFNKSSIGTMYLLDSKFKMLNQSDKPENFAEIQKQVKKGNSGHFLVNDSQYFYEKIAGYNWTYVVKVPIASMTIMAEVILNNTTIVGIIAVFLTLIVLSILTKAIFKDIKPTVEALKEVGDGAVSSVSLHFNEHSKKETDILMESVTSMAHKIHALVSEVKQLTSETDQTASAVLEKSNEQINISNDVENRVHSVVVAVEELTASFSDVIERTSSASLAANEINNTSKQASLTMNNLSSHIDSTKKNIENSATAIHELSNSANEISTVAEQIDSIAEQTNLLALNAAIEAARAGDAGRGFSVVADEVRQLAQRTQQNVVDIKNVISNLQQQSGKTVNSIELVNDSISKVEEATEQTLSEISAVSESIGGISGQLESIATATEEQGNVTNKISQMQNNLADNMQASSVIANDVQSLASQIKENSENLNSATKIFR